MEHKSEGCNWSIYGQASVEYKWSWYDQGHWGKQLNQAFLSLDKIIFEEPFNASLFVDIRKQMGLKNVEKVNELIYTHSLLQMKKAAAANNKTNDDVDGSNKSEYDFP